MSGLDFNDILKLQQQMQRMESEFDQFIRQFLLRQGLKVIEKAKSNTPTDTGLLKNAWTMGDGIAAAKGNWSASKKKISYTEDTANSKAATINSIKRQGDYLILTIINPVEYASFVEYGHMTRDRKRWIEGQFMCTLAIDEVAKLIPQRFAAEFAVWIGRLGL